MTIKGRAGRALEANGTVDRDRPGARAQPTIARGGIRHHQPRITVELHRGHYRAMLLELKAHRRPVRNRTAARKPARFGRAEHPVQQSAQRYPRAQVSAFVSLCQSR